MSDTVLVGIDAGTTRIKAVAMDPSGHELATATAPTPWRVDGRLVDADAAGIADAARHTTAAALDQLDSPHVAAVGVTGMAESGVLLGRNGEPVSPIVAWHDPRGDIDRLTTELADFSVRTGLPATPVPSIAKLPILLADAGGRASRWLNVPEWIVRSFGGDEFAEMSLAARTGLQDLETGRWWDDALSYLGVDASLMPGEARLGIDGAGTASFAPIAGAALVVAGHDDQVAAFGEDATGSSNLFNSLGTAEALVRMVEPPVPREHVADLTTHGCSIGRTVVAERLAVITGFRTGMMLERISTLLGYTESFARTALSERAADGRPHPTLTVELVDGAVDIGGIDDRVTPEDLWRTAVTSADRHACEALDYIDALFGFPTDIVLGGGWVRDPTVRRVKHDRFTNYRCTDVNEPGAAGAARIAGIHVGASTGHDDRDQR